VLRFAHSYVGRRVALLAFAGLAFSGGALVMFGASTARADTADTLDPVAESYRPLMISDIDQSLADSRKLQKFLDSNDLDGAKKAWVDARVGWERAEVFTSGFVSDLDQEIDAWPNAATGFHAIEAKLFGANVTDIKTETSTLVYNLADLDVKVHYMPLNAQGLFNGTARLAYEVGESKADGGESRFSGTSLDDIRNNVDGIALAYKTLFAPALVEADPKLAAATQANIDQLAGLVAVKDLRGLDPDKLRTKTEDLVINLQAAAPKIGLRTPTLEDIAQ
jgi:iron uptake system component EfeO